jgi:hypothetical protein
LEEPCFTPSCLIGFFFFHIHFLYIHIHIIMVLYKEWSLNCVSCVIVVRLYLVITCGEHVKELGSYGVGCKFAQKRCCMLSNFISSFHDFFIIVDVVDVWNYCTKLFYFFVVMDPCGVGYVITLYCFGWREKIMNVDWLELLVFRCS